MAANKKGKQVPSNAREIREEHEPILRTFPPGMRFRPYDAELIKHYLQVKIKGGKLPPHMMMDINLYDYHPEDLKDVYPLPWESRWYFFTPRERKYPNGDRPNRTARGGYWKATGQDSNIETNGQLIGMRKALVFYNGKPPKGEKTNWIMHEYTLAKGYSDQIVDRDVNVLDEWVLCKIYVKGGKKPEEEMETIDALQPRVRKESTIGNEFHSSTQFRDPNNGCSTQTNNPMSNTFFQYLMEQSSYVHPMAQMGQAQPVEPISQVPYMKPMAPTQIIKPGVHSISEVPYEMPMSQTHTNMEPGVQTMMPMPQTHTNMEPGVQTMMPMPQTHPMEPEFQPVTPISRLEELGNEVRLTNTASLVDSSFQDLEYMGKNSSFQDLEYMGEDSSFQVLEDISMDIPYDIDIDFDQCVMDILDNYLRETTVVGT